MTAPTRSRTVADRGVGRSVIRPDGIAKVDGSFAYVGDMHVDGMLFAATRRAYIARGRIIAIDTTPAYELSGVHAVITIDDVPGAKYQGQVIKDQPVLALDEIRHWGEAVAVVAAEDPETARLAADAIVVELEPLEALTDVGEALERGEFFRHVRIRSGDQDAVGDVVVEGVYAIAAQDQAPLGNEAGLAVPDGAGGVDIWGPSQWVHVDLGQIVACLALTESDVRIHPAAIGGAFGAREDLSVQTHLGLLALRTGRPVKASYSRTESFAGHVKRHSARMRYRHEADREGNLVRVEAHLLLDGGAYAMTSEAVIGNASYFATGAYHCGSVSVDGYALRTNHPSSGAMRGFGANQVVFAVEAQMDRLADELGIDPLDLRMRNVLATGSRLPTSQQIIDVPLPIEEALRTVMAMPLPDAEDSDDPRRLPGGPGLTTQRRHVVRGTGYAVGIKNLEFSEGFDDYAEAAIELTPDGAVVQTAAIEVGQGMVTVLAQIARSVLGMDDVTVDFEHTGLIGSAGSTSASRQTQMSGNAVLKAAEAVRQRLLEEWGGDALDDEGVWDGDRLVATLEEMCRDGPVRELVRFHHRGSEQGDADGHGSVDVDFCIAVQRAVVDVDPDLGLVRVVRIDTAQDVGFALNPVQVIGQIEGGIAQGLGHAVMEELVFRDGILLNPNFTDYLLPTALDMPDVESALVEEPSPWGPFGAKGFAELPTVTATPAVVAAIRNATRLALRRAPVRPEDIALA